MWLTIRLSFLFFGIMYQLAALLGKPRYNVRASSQAAILNVDGRQFAGQYSVMESYLIDKGDQLEDRFRYLNLDINTPISTARTKSKSTRVPKKLKYTRNGKTK